LPNKPADIPNVLTAPCCLKPTRVFEHGMVCEYEIPVLDNDNAILKLVAGKGWELIVRDARTGMQSSRGLFATPYDALMLMSAEVQQQIAERAARCARSNGNTPPQQSA
jgi:hypothetical protein